MLQDSLVLQAFPNSEPKYEINFWKTKIGGTREKTMDEKENCRKAEEKWKKLGDRGKYIVTWEVKEKLEMVMEDFPQRRNDEGVVT